MNMNCSYCQLLGRGVIYLFIDVVDLLANFIYFYCLKLEANKWLKEKT